MGSSLRRASHVRRPVRVPVILSPFAGRHLVRSQFPVPDRRPPLPGEVLVRVETALGTIDIAVDTKRAPITAANFLKYVDGGFYDGGRFHRATRPDNYTPPPPDKPAMEIIQGGINPERRRDGFPAIPLERTSVTGLKHVVGTVSMARAAAADTRAVRLLHLPRRSAVARFRRQAVRRRPGWRRVRPRREGHGRRPQDSAAAGRKAGDTPGQSGAHAGSHHYAHRRGASP